MLKLGKLIVALLVRYLYLQSKLLEYMIAPCLEISK